MALVSLCSPTQSNTDKRILLVTLRILNFLLCFLLIQEDRTCKKHKNNRVVADAFHALLSFSLPFSNPSKPVHILLCYK